MHLEEYDEAARWFPLNHSTRGFPSLLAIRWAAYISPDFVAAKVTEALKHDPYNPLLQFVLQDLRNRGVIRGK